MKLIKLDAIDSTNDYLKALHRKVVLDDEVIVLAHHQTRGRGQAASNWYSEAGKSLVFSVFKRISGLDSKWQFAVNWAVSLGVKNGLERCGMNKIIIKWPNDILAGDRKICGILIENQWHAQSMISSIIGVGINVNNENFSNLPKASSMKLASHRDYDMSMVLREVVQSISSELDRLMKGEYEDLKRDYEQHLFRINTVSEFENNEGVRWKGSIKGVSNQGQLCLELEDGSLQLFEMKQLQLRY
ncbi:MAG: biotin--[acetyl-CoA-carboxylase] ligase [Bacteroidota bacterium]